MGEASRRGTKPQRIAQAIAAKEEAARLRQEEIDREAERSRQRKEQMRGLGSIGRNQIAFVDHIVGPDQRFLELQPERRQLPILVIDDELRRPRVGIVGMGRGAGVILATLLIAGSYPVVNLDEEKTRRPL